MPRIAVGALDGTIAMTSETGTGVTPTLQCDDLVAAVPQLRDVAQVTATTLATKPSASLTTTDLRSVLDWADTEVIGGATGVVITQGTDTIEETASWLDLHWDHPEPLVVTGAMRSRTTAGADGPAGSTDHDEHKSVQVKWLPTHSVPPGNYVVPGGR